MPLAITQGAAHMKKPRSCAMVAQYLGRLAKGNLDRKQLLQKDIRDLRRDRLQSDRRHVAPLIRARPADSRISGAVAGVDESV